MKHADVFKPKQSPPPRVIPAIVPRDTSKPETITSLVDTVTINPPRYTCTLHDDPMGRTLVVVPDREGVIVLLDAKAKNRCVKATITQQGKRWVATVEKI